MSKKFLSGINVTGTATLNTVANAGLDTDKFLVLDAAGNVDFRTGAELKVDIGADVVSRVEHEVKLGETMTIGTPVYVGVDLNAGTNMTVYKATNATEAGSSKTLGLIASSGITNDLVEVVTEGLLAGLNTSAATKGDPVWLGVDGALLFGLANKPVAPAHMVFLGIVTRVQSNNGEIFVKVQNGFEMNEIHNYLQGSVQNNEVIVYESATSLYKPKSIPTILGYTPVPDSRTITINGTTYDLSANRAWTITTDASARSILRYVATANQTTFTISGGYTPGLTDVYRNGVKLDNSTDFTATNGTTIVLTNGASVNDVIEVYRYQTAFLANNALRTVTEFIATAGQTTFNVTYNSGLVDVFYNGSKLLSTEYTAGNGTSIVLNFPCNVNDTLEVHAYSYQVGAFSGQAQLNGTGFVKVSGTTVTYDNSTYLTTASASSTYLPLSGGTLTGALSGTSATFSGAINLTGTANTFQVASIFRNANRVFFGGDTGGYFFQNSGNTATILQIADSGAATFSAATQDAIQTVIRMSGYNASGQLKALDFKLTAGTPLWTISTAAVGTDAGINIMPNGSAGLSLAYNGAATFSSSVTAGVSSTSNYGTINDVGIFNNVPSGGSSSNPAYYGGIRFTGGGYDWGAIRTIQTTPSASWLNRLAFFTQNGAGGAALIERMAIDNNGNVGIGTSIPDSQLVINGSSNSRFNMRAGDTRYGTLYADAGVFAVASITSIPLVFGTNDVERMRINSTGQVGINTTTFDYGERLGLYNPASYTLQSKRSGTGYEGHFVFSNANGVVGTIFTNGSSTDYNTSSDYRLKKDLKNYNGLGLISKIKTYDFAWKVDESRMFGVIAHELQEVLPYAVTGEKDAEMMQGVDYSKIVPILVKAIQEQQQMIEELKALIAAK